MSFSDICLVVQLFRPNLLSFLSTRSRFKAFVKVFKAFLYGFLISKLLAIIFNPFLLNLWFVSNNSISDSVDFSCGCVIPFSC